MAKIRDDFPLPALVMPEFLRPGSDLYAFVPREMHEARRFIASSMALDIHKLERWLVDDYKREPSAEHPPESYMASNFRTKLGLYLGKDDPLAGSAFPFFKPTVKELRASYESSFASLISRFSFDEEVKSGNVQVTIESLRQDAPYLFFFRYLKNPSKVAARLYFGVIYHSWKSNVTFNHLASDYRTDRIFKQSDVQALLQVGCDYITGISAFLDSVEKG